MSAKCPKCKAVAVQDDNLLQVGGVKLWHCLFCPEQHYWAESETVTGQKHARSEDATASATRTITVVEAELKKADAESTYLLEACCDALNALHEEDSPEAFRRFTALKEREFVVRKTTDTLEAELEQLLSTENGTQKRARLNSSYEAVVAEFKVVSDVVESAKAELVTSKTNYEKAQQIYFQCQSALTQSKETLGSIVDNHRRTIDSYEKAFLATPYVRGEPCPFCKKPMVATGKAKRRLICESKCVVHIAGGGVVYRDKVNLHKGTVEQCESLLCRYES